VFTPEQHRAEAADYTDLAKQGNAPKEVRKFLRHEQSLSMLADNEQWLQWTRSISCDALGRR
jgi:hypothetical protein